MADNHKGDTIMNFDHEQQRKNSESMKEELKRDYKDQVSTRLWFALLNSGYPNLAAAKADFEKDLDRASRAFLSIHNAGKKPFMS
jgi:hypothetical protein